MWFGGGGGGGGCTAGGGADVGGQWLEWVFGCTWPLWFERCAGVVIGGEVRGRADVGGGREVNL